MELKLGTTVERYVIEKEIGEGGVGRVYKVRHTELGTLHALKVVQSNDEQTRQRLLNEGRFQASVNHPGIVNVTDVIKIDGAPGLIMEYIDGPSIFELLKMTRLSVRQVSILGSRMLEAVGTAHDFKLVHRDLKPANILISMRNRDVFPKICDFGIAKALTKSGPEHALTQAGHRMGTPAHMAPEQFDGSEDIDHRADLFAMGIILYEMVAHRKPFDGAYPYPQMLDGDYERLEASDEIPQRFISAIDFALIADPDKRAQRARHLQMIWEGEATPEDVADLCEEKDTGFDTSFFEIATLTNMETIKDVPVAATREFAVQGKLHEPEALSVMVPVEKAVSSDESTTVRLLLALVVVLLVAVIGVGVALYAVIAPQPAEPAPSTEAPAP